MNSFKHTVSDPSHLRAGLVRYARSFDDAVILDSSGPPGLRPGHQREFRFLAGFGNVKRYPSDDITWKGLDEFLADQREKGVHVLGFLSYDLKNRVEHLRSDNPDRLGFPDMFLMVPEILVKVTDGIMEIFTQNRDPKTVYEQIEKLAVSNGGTQVKVGLKPLISKDQYLEKVKSLKKHIQRGDIYEVNFCHEFYAEQATIDPYSVYSVLGERSPNPFGCFVKHNGKYLMCASPERFLRKESGVLTSQPMKGTMPRNSDPVLDEENRRQLEHSAKDRAENVMIVDLTRNDLSRVAKRASVKVPELCSVHSFPNVHQMISTVQCEVRDDVSFSDIIKATFPMGSMTGAPKVRAIQLIEQYEPMKRGIFSGSVGHWSPNGDFDLNVVIRSMMYAEDKEALSVMAGGAITHLSDPEKEYEESIVKMRPLFEVLGHEMDPATGEYA
jgi:para-aminobenzoate synthetase component 1